MSLVLGWGAYARDENTSAMLCAKKAGGLCARGGVFAGHYGNCTCYVIVHCNHDLLPTSAFSEYIL